MSRSFECAINDVGEIYNLRIFDLGNPIVSARVCYVGFKTPTKSLINFESKSVWISAQFGEQEVRSGFVEYLINGIFLLCIIAQFYLNVKKLNFSAN